MVKAMRGAIRIGCRDKVPGSRGTKIIGTARLTESISTKCLRALVSSLAEPLAVFKKRIFLSRNVKILH